LFCEACGNDVAAGARFCSYCGTQRGEAVPENFKVSSTVNTQHESAWKTLCIIIGIGLFIASIAFFRYRQFDNTAANLAASKPAIETVGKLDAAIGVGINFLDYTRRLQDAAAAVDTFEPSDGTGKKVKDFLSKAVLYYKAAHEAWNASVNSNWIYDGMNLPSHWVGKYPDLNISFTGSVPYMDELRQRAWNVAGKAYREAKSTAATYGN